MAVPAAPASAETVGQMLHEAVQKFNAKAATDEKLATEIAGITRTVQVEVSDGPWWHFRIEGGQLTEPAQGQVESPDIRIIASGQTLLQLYTRELRPMKALALRKLHLKASLDDMVRLRKFF